MQRRAAETVRPEQPGSLSSGTPRHTKPPGHPGRRLGHPLGAPGHLLGAGQCVLINDGVGLRHTRLRPPQDSGDRLLGPPRREIQ